MPPGVSRMHGWRSSMAGLSAASTLVFCGLCWAQGTTTKATGGLERRVQSVLSQARLGTARVGVSIVDVATGRELVDIQTNAGAGRAGANQPLSPGSFVPASNLKLLSSGAALAVLGKDFEFQTKFIWDGADSGRLIVRGSGDPAFADPDLLDKMRLGVDQFVDRLVDSMKAAGVSGVKEIVLDDRVFDREYVNPEWPTEQLSRPYCAQVNGLNFHANLLNVYVTPGASVGSEPGVRTEPSGSWLQMKRLAKTVKEGNTEVWLDRDAGTAFGFRVHGTVRTALTEPVQVTVNEPSLMLGRVLADRLMRSGLGTGIQARLIAPDEELYATADRQKVVALVKTPISVVLERCNVDSDNLYAESLLKLAGHTVTKQPGSWSNGASVVRMQLRDKLGADIAGSLVLSDGSGLARSNRVTPTMLAKWLAEMAKESSGPLFVRSLALAGEEGTLRRRFRGSKLKNEIRAKSGYIREVRTLSGYVTHEASGQRIAFSVLVNNVPAGADQRAKEFHENVVEAVDQWLFEQHAGTQSDAGGSNTEPKSNRPKSTQRP